MFNDYFEKNFMNDFGSLEFKRYQNIINNEIEYFFAGCDWNNIERDLKNISDKENFILSLYFIELVEMNMYANFKAQYNSFRAKTLFPKFGYIGMGPHYYYPQNLILFASNKELLNISSINQKTEEFVDAILVQYKKNHEAGIFPVPAKLFFEKVIADKDNFKVDPEGFVTKSMDLIAKRL